MKKLIIGLAVFSLIFVDLVYGLECSKDQKLPNFANKPYYQYLRGMTVLPYIHPEWGDIQVVLYGNHEIPQRNFVAIFYDKEGMMIYAEFSFETNTTREGGCVIGYFYNFSSHKYVFDNSKSLDWNQ